MHPCEEAAKAALTLPLFALFSGKSSSGLFLSSTEIFPGPWLRHLPWRRLMVRRRRGICRQLPTLHFPSSQLSEHRVDTSSLRATHPVLECLSAQHLQYTPTGSRRVSRGLPGQVYIDFKSKPNKKTRNRTRTGTGQQRVPQVTHCSSGLTSCRLS